ncbi:stalk domain-containing protein [Gorillibacterium sp. sgz5001074]|uniref:stalk domain-containing protein n=1 Tax=Gorillibacterium sp. sgz5001074 TaxID=3446695 RepID=UPI003F66DCCF
MNRILSILGISVLASSLAGGAGAAAAELSKQALVADGGRWMTETTVYAGTGDLGVTDGLNLESTFRMPESIALAADGSLLVSDSRNQVIRKLTGERTSLYAGVNLLKDAKGFPVGGLADGQAEASFFNQPAGLAVDAQGSVYVADAGNHAIRKISAGGQVTTLAGGGVLGRTDGQGKNARFHTPKDVAVAADGSVFVADTLNHLIRKVAPDGTVTTLNASSARVVEVFPGNAVAAGDYRDGDLKSAKFNEPSGLALDAKGNLYVSDTGNQRIRYIDLKAGTVTTVAGGGLTAGKVYPDADLYAAGDYADGQAADARFDFPAGIAVTAEGGLLIADSMNHSVRYLKDGTVRTLAGKSNQFPGEEDGIEGYGELHAPSDVVELADGRILVADAFNNRIRMIRLSQLPSGIAADGSIHVVLNGKTLRFEVAPEYSAEGRTMVPVRAIAEAAGYEVTYKQVGAAEYVGLADKKIAVEMAIGQASVKRTEAGKAAKEVKVDAAPYLKQDRTLVPLRFFAENLGIDVQWDEQTSTAVLRSQTFVKAE